MADYRVSYLPEGSSTSAPPAFDHENFIYWQQRMKIFIKATEYGLWDVFQIGNYIPTEAINGQTIPKCQSKFNNEDEQLVLLNDKAIHILACALSDKELIQVAHLESAKEMWDALEFVYGESREEASSQGECSDSNEKENICLVAEGEEAETDSDSDEVNDSESSYDELLSEYNSMHSEFERIAKELICAKKKIKYLEEKLNDIPTATQTCEKCIESEKESIELKKTLEKFTHSSEMLSVLNGNQRRVSDQSGIIKDPVPKREEKKKNKFSNCFNSSFFTHCYYCNRAGHSATSCYFKKNESHGTFKWVPKGTYVPKAKYTNRSGPKRKRVPKYPPIFTSFQDIAMNGRIDQQKRKMLKRANQKINLMRARETVPHSTKIIQKRKWWRQGKARASMIDYHKVPYNYRKLGKMKPTVSI